MILRSVNPFALRDLAFSHGWIALAPWSWRRDPPALMRVERLPSGAVVPIEVTSNDPTAPSDSFYIRLPARLSQEERGVLERRLRWMLRLDEEFTSFHALLRTLPGCEPPAARGEGRLLRSCDFYEDAVKTIATTNTTWAQTKSMVARLVERWGEPAAVGATDVHIGPASRSMPECGLQPARQPSPLTPGCSDESEGPTRAFPEPHRLAAASDVELRQAGLGYRATAVQRLAAAIAAGDLPRQAPDWAALPSDELYRRLLALNGVGPYAAANLLLLLGHYDRLAIDSWLRRAVRDAWFAGAAVTDREIEAEFERFSEWRALVYWFHPQLHPGRDAWRENTP
jgi:3-methyladenine DNA glycosylase/8-oxoguanine DNA glycosylase